MRPVKEERRRGQKKVEEEGARGEQRGIGGAARSVEECRRLHETRHV